MSRTDLVMATHGAAVGPRTHSVAVVGIPRQAERSSRAPTLKWLLWAIVGDDGPLGLMLALCFAQSGRFLEPSCQLRIGSGPRDRWFESTRPDQFTQLVTASSTAGRFRLQRDCNAGLRLTADSYCVRGGLHAAFYHGLLVPWIRDF